MSRWIYSLSKQQTHTIMTYCLFLMIATFFLRFAEKRNPLDRFDLLDLFRKIKVAVMSLFARVMIDTFFGILLRNKIRFYRFDLIDPCHITDKNWMMVSKGSPFISYALLKWPTQLVEWSNVPRIITKKEFMIAINFFTHQRAKKNGKRQRIQRSAVLRV